MLKQTKNQKNVETAVSVNYTGCRNELLFTCRILALVPECLAVKTTKHHLISG